LSGLSARAAEDGQTQVSIWNQANADIKAARYDQGCADYARLLAASDGFQHLDSRLLALKSQTPASELESKVQTYTDSKQYAKACIDAYILALRYLGEGASNKADLYTARALDMEGQALKALKEEAKPASTPATQTQSEAQPPASGEAAGVSDWSQIAGTYVCQSYGYTGAMQNVGGMLQPVFGLVPAGINVSIGSPNSYGAQMAGKVSTASLSFSRTVPGGAKPGLLGVIEFTGGPLAGRRALLQTDQQFRHAIIFP